jgi:RecA/RadA recombinase
MAKKKKTRKKVARKPAKGKKAKVRIKRDPHAEYLAMMNQKSAAKVAKLSNDECISNIPGRISTQSLSLDKLLRDRNLDGSYKANGGIPLSRTTEIFGPPHIGKSTLLDHIFASVQKMGGMAILADTEVSRDRYYTHRIGVNLDKLKYLEFKRDESYIENVVTEIYRSIDWFSNEFPDLPVVIGWDALGGTATLDEVKKGLVQVDRTGPDKGKPKNTKPGAAAKVMHRVRRELGPKLGGTKIALVVLNHEYEMIQMGGGFKSKFAGKKKETFGGSAVRHSGSLRIQLYSSGENIKNSEGVILGREVVAKIVKNRLGDAWTQATVPIISGVGVDNLWTIISTLKATGSISTGGGWSSINLDGQIIKFQGWNGLRQKCLEEETLYSRLVSVYHQMVP